MATSAGTPSKATTFTEGDGDHTSTADDTTVKSQPRKKYKQNWRLNLLSMPRNPREKYSYPPDTPETGVSPGALKGEATERVDHMSRPPVRTLVINKKQFMDMYKDYGPKMDQKIELSWNSMYNCYKKARRDISRKTSTTSKRSRTSSRGRPKDTAKPSKETKPGKGGKGDAKKAKGKKEKGKKGKKGEGEGKTTAEKKEEDMEKAMEEWIELRSKPKKVFLPEPIARGPIADLLELKEKTDLLATPKKVYTVEEKDPTKIAEAALVYTPTERIVELARPPAFRLVKEEPCIPGAVKPEALTFIASERIKQLAMPKVTQNANDTDIKEDPFAISPNALKYVATERIKELAKPVER